MDSSKIVFWRALRGLLAAHVMQNTVGLSWKFPRFSMYITLNGCGRAEKETTQASQVENTIISPITLACLLACFLCYLA